MHVYLSFHSSVVGQQEIQVFSSSVFPCHSDPAQGLTCQAEQPKLTTTTNSILGSVPGLVNVYHVLSTLGPWEVNQTLNVAPENIELVIHC